AARGLVRGRTHPEVPRLLRADPCREQRTVRTRRLLLRRPRADAARPRARLCISPRDVESRPAHFALARAPRSRRCATTSRGVLPVTAACAVQRERHLSALPRARRVATSTEVVRHAGKLGRTAPPRRHLLHCNYLNLPTMRDVGAGHTHCVTRAHEFSTY